MFLLQADDRTVEGFNRYREYVMANAAGFPPGGLLLAQSEWYYGPFDHRAPHDARLEAMSIAERAGGTGGGWHDRDMSIEVRLRGAYDDGFIILRYPTVHFYELSGPTGRGHADWRYDEIRLDDENRLVHEVEWSTGARWLVVADDVVMLWHADGSPEQVVAP